MPPALPRPNLVPVVAGQLELGACRQLDLRQRDEVVEAGLAGRFLLDEPAHRRQIGVLGEPGEERIILTGPVVAQPLVPGDEGIGLRWHLDHQRTHHRALAFDEPTFEQTQAGLGGELVLPVRGRRCRREPLPA